MAATVPGAMAAAVVRVDAGVGGCEHVLCWQEIPSVNAA
jgi:hypothetical protein